MKKIYLFYRAAVLDGLIPFSAVTGINIKDMSIKSVFDVTNYAGINESLVSMSKGFSELLFSPINDKIKLNSNKVSGIITGYKMVFSDGENEYRSITDPYICTSSIPIKFNVILTSGTGIKRTHELTGNKDINEKYIPVRPDFGLYRYIVVSGYSETAIYHRIIKDIDLDALREIIINFLLDNKKVEAVEEKQIAIRVNDIFEALYKKASLYGKAIKALNEIYYLELKKDEEYTNINDEYFFESQKAEQIGRELSENSEISIKKINREYQIFKDLFVRDNVSETAQYLSGIKRVSYTSAEKIADIIHEYV
ncbi:MAG: hypothetical protein IJ583_11755 [Firmicutes bacterium]|nr:hypothetical protein [Bacillota bacterium]